MKKMCKKALLMSIMVMLVGILTACSGDALGGKKEIVEVGDFTIPIYSSYKLSEEDSSDNVKMYENTKSKSAITLNSTFAMYSSLDAYVEFYKGLILESPDGAGADITTENCSVGDMKECCWLSYTFVKDGEDRTLGSYIIYSNNSVLVVSECRPGKSEEKIKKELTDLAGQAKYIGEFIMPEEDQYPYTVTSDFGTVTIDEGLICEQANMVGNGNAVLKDGDMIKIRLRKADSYNRGGLSKLTIGVANDQTKSAKDLALCGYENRLEKGDATYKEATLGELIPGIWSELENITAYKVDHLMQTDDIPEDGVCGESYYFEYKGTVYNVALFYIHGDEEVRAAFMEQMKNVTLTGEYVRSED